jgi:hypothetical protein
MIEPCTSARYERVNSFRELNLLVSNLLGLNKVVLDLLGNLRVLGSHGGALTFGVADVFLALLLYLLLKFWRQRMNMSLTERMECAHPGRGYLYA